MMAAAYDVAFALHCRMGPIALAACRDSLRDDIQSSEEPTSGNRVKIAAWDSDR